MRSLNGSPVPELKAFAPILHAVNDVGKLTEFVEVPANEPLMYNA